MYDSGKIILGIVIFLILVTFPFWFNMGKAGPAPKLQLPKDEKQCVAATEYMRAAHMDVLNEWRDEVVREGKRVYVGLGGKKYNMSLQNTCMKCHNDKAQFCDKCHDYMGVAPKCWECHIEPVVKKSVVKTSQRSQ